LRQEFNIDITEINKDTTQVSILIVLKEKINKNIYDSKKKSIHQVVEKIKDFINTVFHDDILLSLKFDN
jgi:nitrogen-specific signal transduction histidine kinase